MTNSIIEMPEVGVQLPEWWITLPFCGRQYAQMWGNGSTRYLLTRHGRDLKVIAVTKKHCAGDSVERWVDMGWR